MSHRFIDWIWHIKGSMALPHGQSSDEAFDRLDPLFREYGTNYERTNDTLTFTKKGQGAQDKMSVFDDGILQIERSTSGSVLHYRLTSRILLFCFLAPLMFLGFAQLTIYIGKMEKASTEAASKSKAAEASKKAEKKKAEHPQNPVDKFLGAPAPEKPKKDDDKSKDEDDKHSPTPAYVFAGLFAALYVVGRILEEWLVKTLFRKRLSGL